MKKNYVLSFLFALVMFISYGQTKEIKGQVLDENQVPLAGASVLVTGTATGAATDFDGYFTINVPEGGETLTVSYLGYETKVVPIENSSQLTIILTESNQLDEIVLVGYGQQRKQDVTGAVARVTSENFNPGSALGVNDLIQGKVAGLNISSAGSDPTQGPSIQLRGPSTINGGDSKPFFVVDGVPGASLAGIAPQDIESIDVLKDASSTAIYGTRAANGVIIVTTKRPKSGESFLRYSTFVSTESVDKKVDVANASQLVEEITRQGQTLPAAADLGFDTDWQDEITRAGFKQNHNITFGGGSAKSSYTASLSYVDQEGVVITSGQEEIRGRIRAYSKLFDDRLTADISLAGATIKSRLTDYNAFYHALQYLPTVPVRNDDGTFFQNLGLQDYLNPVSMLELDNNRRKFTTLTGIAKLNLKITDEFSAELNSVIQNSRTDNARYIQTMHPEESPNGANAGSLARRSSEGTNTTIETLLKYNKTFNENHVLEVLGGYSWQKDTFGDGLGATSFGYFTDRLDIYGLGYQLETQNIGVGNTPRYGESKLISLFGRANYVLMDKYVFQASIRRDGSTKFGENNKWANFPAASVAWKIGEEDFLKDSNTISELKLRVGFGVSGNQDIGTNISRFIRTPTGTSLFNGNLYNVFAIIRNANPDLRWEKTTTTNFGLDFGLFGGRLSGSLDIYDKTTTDLLFTYSVPVPPNFVDTTVGNGGEISNKGVEVSLQGQIIQNNDFSWNSTFNIAFNKNEVVNLESDFDSPEEIRVGGIPGRAIPGQTAQIIRPGEPLGTFFMNDYLYTNSDNNRVYLASDGSELVGDDAGIDDYYIVGNAQPDFIFNFGNTFSYKKFSMSFLLRGMIGHDILNATRMNTTRLGEITQYNSNNQAISEGVLDGPKVSDFFLEDGSFIRLDNLTFSYQLPETKLFKSATVSVTGENLFTITDYTGLDPEINLNLPLPGIESIRPVNGNNGAGPVFYRAKTFTLGLNVNF